MRSRRRERRPGERAERSSLQRADLAAGDAADQVPAAAATPAGPSTSAPSTSAPSTSAPSTSAPSTSAPSTSVPASDAVGAAVGTVGAADPSPTAVLAPGADAGVTAEASATAVPQEKPAVRVPEVRGGTFRSLKVRNYRLYFTGNVICQTGTWMNRVAQDWLVLQLSNDDPVALGVATALQFGPTLLLSVFAGSVADRADKRTLLRWIQVVLSLAGVVLGILAWTGVAQIWHVFAACVVVGTAASFDGPVRQSFVAELVGPSQLPNAVALNSMGFNGARIIGPAIAGVLISVVDTGPVMTLTGLSYIAVIIGLSRMDPAQLRRSPPLPRRRGRSREGLRYVRGRRDLLLVMALLFMVATFGMNFQVTLAIMAKIVFGTDAASYGLLSTAIAVGALGGALLSARRSRAPRQRLLIGTAFAFGVLECLLGFVTSYELLALLLIPQGVVMLTFVNAANSMVQMTTTPSMRGRVMGIYTLAFLGGAPFYSPTLGIIAEHFGGGAPLIFGGAVSALAALVIGIWLLRTSPVRIKVRVSPLLHLHLANPAVDGPEGADEHLSETIAGGVHRIGGGARRGVRPAVRVARRVGGRVGGVGRRVVRRPARRR